MSESLSIFQLYCGYTIISPFSLLHCFFVSFFTVCFCFFSGNRWSIQQRHVSVLASVIKVSFVISGWLADTVAVTIEPHCWFYTVTSKPSTNTMLALSHPACHSIGQVPHTHSHTDTSTHHTVTYCSIYLIAALLRRPWTLRMRWMSFSDGPSTHAASTSWGRITSRSSYSPFRPPTSRKRLVFDWSWFENHHNSLSN